MASNAPSTEAPIAPPEPPNLEFAAPADAATIDRVAAALEAKGYRVHVVDDREAAKRLILELVPEGAEVSQGASVTLQELGITEEIEGSGRYDAIRPRTRAMDRTTPEGLRAMRKLGGTPDYWLNSVHAVTLDGTLVIASNTGSQLGPIAFGAGTVIFAVGAQKIVPDLETAMRRIREYAFPLEDAKLRKQFGMPSAINKILIVNREFRPGRFAVILIRQPIGY